jgi:hypothetical protein
MKVLEPFLGRSLSLRTIFLPSFEQNFKEVRRCPYRDRVFSPQSLIPNPAQRLSSRNLLLFPNIFKPHKPARRKTAHRCSSRQVKHSINTLRICQQYAGQLRSIDNRSKARRAGIDDSLGINGRRVFGDESLEAVGEDGVGEAEEQGAGERLAEHGERHGDGNLSRR